MDPRILVLAAAFAAPALAQQPGSTSERQDANPAAPAAAAAGASGGFSTMDRNTDGYISRDEARDQAWTGRFSELDRDNDNRLSEAEYITLQEAARGAAAGATREDTTEAKKQ